MNELEEKYEDLWRKVNALDEFDIEKMKKMWHRILDELNKLDDE